MTPMTGLVSSVEVELGRDVAVVSPPGAEVVAAEPEALPPWCVVHDSTLPWPNNMSRSEGRQ